MAIPSAAFANPIDDIVSFFVGESRVATAGDGVQYDADTDTTQNYTLGNESSTQYDGRVWVDKSVSAEDKVTFGSTEVTNDSDFLVTYSALATSTNTVGVTPTDTVFILDFSTSMTWGYSQAHVSVAKDQSRIQAMITSVNNAIDALVKANPQNRIAIAVFNGSSTTLLPNLTTGTAILQQVSDGNYLSIYDYTYTPGQDGGRADVRCNINDTTTSTGGGTNIQAGMFAGMEILADNTYTTAEVNGETVTRIPNVILMSDGAPTTFSSATDATYIRESGGRHQDSITNDTDLNSDREVQSGSWWSTNSGKAIGSGDNDNPDSADGFMALLTASYYKNAITDRYYGNSGDEANIYTISFGTDVQTDAMVAMANLVLNPEGNWDSGATQNTDQVRAVVNAWNTYSQNNEPVVQAPIGHGNNDTKVNFRVSHPTGSSAAYDPDSLFYPTQYFAAADDEQLEQIFEEIASMITSSASVPTEVTGNPMDSGYITYKDTTGQYMEIKNVKTLIFMDQVLNVTKTSSTEGRKVYVADSYEYNNPAYPGQSFNTNQIKIVVTDNGDNTQTIEVNVPAALIPLRTNTVTLDGNGVPTNNETSETMPLRLCYEVGLAEGIDAATLNGVDEDYLKNNSENGKVSFYSNAYTEGGQTNNGVGATVEFEPAPTNPFYFVQENTPLYVADGVDAEGNPKYVRATGGLDSSKTYYVPMTYYDGAGSEVKEITSYVARSGETLAGFVDSDNSGLYIREGSPRIGNLQNVTASKSVNETGTYGNYREPTFVFDQGGTDPQAGHFLVLLGNNGKLSVPFVSKDVSLASDSTHASIDGQLVGVGEKLHYTIDWVNTAVDGNGDAVAATITIVDTLPSGTYIEDGEVPEDATYNAEEGTITWTIQAAAGVSGTVEFDVVVDPAAVDNENNALPNTATITVGNNSYTTNTTVNYVPEKSVSMSDGSGGTADADGETVMPGTQLTYTIEYLNTESTESTVAITDAVPEGTTFVSATGNPTNQPQVGETGNLEWTISNVAAGATGSVSFTVEVDNSAVTTIENEANVKIGDHNPVVTNKVTTNVDRASLIVKKEVTADPGLTAPDKEFDFELTIPSKAGLQNVAATIHTDGEDGQTTSLDFDADGKTTFKLKANQSLEIPGMGSVQYSVVEQNAANGAVNSGFTLSNVEGATGASSAGNDQPINDEETATAAGTLGSDNATVTFTNHYSASGSLDGSTKLVVTKNYTSDLGDPWMPDDRFGFTLEADTSDPNTKAALDNSWITLPDNAGSSTEGGITVTDESKDYQASFGDIKFTRAGTYKFKVYEVMPEGVDESNNWTKDGITYDHSTKTVTVEVTDNGDGTLSAIVAEGSGDLTFNNTYNVGPVMFRAAYFQLQGNKVLDGRNWEQGDTFTFTMTAGVAEINGETVQPNDQRVLDTMPSKTADTIEPLADDSKVTDNSAQFTFTSDRIPGGETVQEDTFTFTQPGTYRYLIQETNPNQNNPGSGILGVTYDQTTYRLEVKVVDKGDGTLDVESYNYSKRAPGETDFTPITGSSEITFTNRYSADEIGVTFNAAKVLDGRGTPMTDGEFKFHMEFAGWKANGSSDDWSMEGDVAENAPEAPADASNIIRGDVTFADTTFTQDHVDYTYRYAITELQPTEDGSMDGTPLEGAVKNEQGQWVYKGVTYDNTTKYVTAEVTSVQSGPDDTGTYKENVRVNTGGEATLNDGATDTTGTFSGEAIFTNKYDPGSTTVDTDTQADFQLTKVLKGKDWNGDQFTFDISPVSAMNDGQEIIAADSPDFPMPAETSLTVDAATGEDKDGNDQAVFSFGNIKYDQEGVYTYKVKEVTPAEGDEGYNAGITYSNNEATVVVTVTDNNEGGYTTAVNISGNKFVNEYHAGADYNAQGAGGLDITKKLNNRNMTADQFTFTIEATGDNAEKAAEKLRLADGETSTTVKNNDGAAGAAVSVVGNPFENMTFDETDDGVTYTYTIKENGTSGEGDYAGYTLDDTTYNVSITATDKGDGTMTVTTDVNGTEYTDTRATVAFENTYKAGDVTVGAEGDAQIVTNKTLKNDDIASYDGKFNFQVTSGDVVVAEGTNDANGNITFGNITYTTENLAAAATAEGSDTVGKANLDTAGEADVYTFNYSVSEVTTSLPGGVSYNSGNTNVTVTVTDDRHGKLSVEVGYADGASSVEFVNTYGAGEDGTAELNLKGNKEIVPGEGLTEAPALVDDTYTFEITGNPASDGTPAPMPQTTTAKNKSGAVEFGTITFTMENVFGGTVSTTTDESEATQETETVEEATTTKETEVTEGAESEETTTEESADSATAENGEKSVVDESATDESLTDVENGDEATADESSKSVKSEKAATAGVTSSDEDVSTQTAGHTKTFTYTIKETDGSVPGVDNDTTVKTVTVTVTDEGNGKISVSKKEAEGADKGNDFTFTNVYNVDPKESSLTGDGGFTITKTLTGRDMAQGEFSFRLQSVDDDSDFWTAPTNPAAADGEAAEITFGDMTFEKPGTYTYTLEEEQGKLGGVEYDTNKYTVIATVTDKDADGNYTGELEVTWQINGAADNTVAFKNTYTAQPATVSLGAGKLMKGRDLSAGEYTFKLSDTNGNEVSTATNEENGAVTFDTITYDQAGEYTYTIIEVTPEDTDPNTEGIQNNGVTYDQTVYNATVKVTDNAKGQLVPTISYGTEDGGAPVFTNTYTAPAEPEQGGEGDGDGGLLGMAKTGDFTGGIMAALAAVVAAAAAGATYAIRKMRRPRGRHAR